MVNVRVITFTIELATGRFRDSRTHLPIRFGRSALPEIPFRKYQGSPNPLFLIMLMHILGKFHHCPVEKVPGCIGRQPESLPNFFMGAFFLIVPVNYLAIPMRQLVPSSFIATSTLILHCRNWVYHQPLLDFLQGHFSGNIPDLAMIGLIFLLPTVVQDT
jgi:hypothetical protein